MPDSSDEVHERLISKGFRVNTVKIPYDDSLTIGAKIIGKPANTALLLIHGSPGDWSAWENIITADQVLEHYFIVAVDRAGYGSTSVPGQATLIGQAKVIRGLINGLALSDIVVVGHSYGGAVAEQLLVDQPSLFKKAIFVAPTLSPGHMEPRWYNSLAGMSWLNNIIPDNMRTSNLEMVNLPASLRQLESKIKFIETPIIYIQGEEDILVPVESIEYYKSVKPLGVEYLRLSKVNHFIPWTDPGLITNILLQRIENDEK